jgi:hypothetical protein
MDIFSSYNNSLTATGIAFGVGVLAIGTQVTGAVKI